MKSFFRSRTLAINYFLHSLPYRNPLNCHPSTNWVPVWWLFHTNLLVFSSEADFQLTTDNWIGRSRSWSHIATDGQLTSKSWCRAPSGAHDQIFNTLWQLRSCFCGAPSLTRGLVCLLYRLLALNLIVLIIFKIIPRRGPHRKHAASIFARVFVYAGTYLLSRCLEKGCINRCSIVACVYVPDVT
jgi:hypothetical protein